jgi:CubicO group peptidase (beta-lactamase class C family)
MRRENVDEFPFDEFRRRFADRPASFEPGTRWQYANAGYTVVAAAVERATGEAFGAALRRQIFEPLGMTRTGYRVPATGDAAHAVGHDLVDGALRRAPHVFSGWGNSGIESTALDLARWAAALDRGALLRPESYRAMYAPARLASGAEVRFPFGGAREASYGLGWFLSEHGGEALLTHGGAIAGFSSVVNRFLARRLTVIVLANAKQGADRLGHADAIGRAVGDVMGVGRPR